MVHQYKLHIDNDPTKHPFSVDNPYKGVYYLPKYNDFIMFSKFNQSDGNITGYYAKCRFVNNSPDKAELFSIGSNVTESSK